MPRAASNLLAALTCAAALAAQPAKRVPVIAGNMHVNVLVEVDGTVKSWGSPADAEGVYLGDGTDGHASRDSLKPMPGVHDIIDAAIGLQNGLLLSRDGTVLAWGRNNMCELGVGDDKKRLTPVPVPGLRGATHIAAADQFSAAVTADGSVWVRGAGDGGLLANGKSGFRTDCADRPVKVEGLTGVKDIASDGSNVIVLKEDGTVWGWGQNGGGQLGDGTIEQRLRPVQMKGITNAVAIAIDGNSVVLLADGTVWMCGSGGTSVAERGKGSTHTTPFKVPGVSGVVAIQIAAGATMVRLRDGTLLGWGLGYQGRLGDGHGDRDTATPHAPIGLGPVIAHYFASNSGYAIKADGTVMAWGIWANGVGPTEWVLKPIPFIKVKLAD